MMPRLTMRNTLRGLCFWLFGLTTTNYLYSQQPNLPAAKRTDSFETKLQLLKSAVDRQDYDLARSLTASLHDTVVQTQHESQTPKPSLLPSDQWTNVETLPAPWRQWATGWNYCKMIQVTEPVGAVRHAEPLELMLSFPSDQAQSIARELRIAKVTERRLIEVPCQVLRETYRPAEKLRHAEVLILLSSQPRQEQSLVLFYGNPNAELPAYPSDLLTEGEGWALDISNAHFKATLSRQTGQLERLTLRREHGLELFAGGEGHGEPPGIDWAHDYVDEGNFQKLRISL